MIKDYDLIKTPDKPYVDAKQFGNQLYISGIAAVDKNDFTIGRGDIEKQTRVCFETIKDILSEFNASFDNILKITVYLRNMEDRAKIVPIRQEYFSKYKPTSTIIEVSKLGKEDLLIEIEAIAYLES